MMVYPQFCSNKEGIMHIEFSFPIKSDIKPRAILSLKDAGDMAYKPKSESPSRLAFFSRFGIEPARIAGIELKHSRNVAFAESKEELSHACMVNRDGFDGIVTTNPWLVPSITVADCMPIWLFCKECGAFGVLHSGWKGTGILKNAVDGMTSRYRCKPNDISVIFGPSIGPCCYSVDENRARAFKNEFGSKAVDEHVEGGRRVFYLDLLAANLAIAEKIGIGSFFASGLCTSCDARFGSYRREGASSFTRMIALCLFDTAD
jgi:hypothetical protein